MTISQEDYTRDLFSYLDNSPTAFHAVGEIRNRLLQNGATELHENSLWSLEKGRIYFTVRENSALAAFTLGSEDEPVDGFRMIGSHSDSPCLQIKPRADVRSAPYLQLGVEIYGGPLLNPWFDRDLSLAGRVCCSNSESKLIDFLIDFKRPLLTIPSLAIHLDREANDVRAIDKQKWLPPLLAQVIDDQFPDFNEILSAQITKQYPDADITEVLGFDLFCYDPQKAAHLGLNEDFITSGRLDNLLSCHVSTTAICSADRKRNTLFLCTNHEENGSTSTTGAQGSFIQDIFARLVPEEQERLVAIRNSFFISIDNAHAVHPNFRDKSEPAHDITLNGGPVIKVNANQRYATNSRSSALFKLLAGEAEVNVQEFVMPTGAPCGSTIGPMTAAKLGMETIDVGAPTLSMHSIREITGSEDPHLLYRVIQGFMNTPDIKRRA